jgi:uncharacterized membrane protein YecN with MAPEG domain
MALPITLVTASVMALFALVLAMRVSRGRMKYRISTGDGGNPDMTARVRSHANFVEFVPLLLVIMALLEANGAAPVALQAYGVALVVARMAHAIGMPRKAPNPYRFVGASLTYLLLIVGAGYGLALAI